MRYNNRSIRISATPLPAPANDGPRMLASAVANYSQQAGAAAVQVKTAMERRRDRDDQAAFIQATTDYELRILEAESLAQGEAGQGGAGYLGAVQAEREAIRKSVLDGLPGLVSDFGREDIANALNELDGASDKRALRWAEAQNEHWRSGVADDQARLLAHRLRESPDDYAAEEARFRSILGELDLPPDVREAKIDAFERNGLESMVRGMIERAEFDQADGLIERVAPRLDVDERAAFDSLVAAARKSHQSAMKVTEAQAEQMAFNAGLEAAQAGEEIPMDVWLALPAARRDDLEKVRVGARIQEDFNGYAEFTENAAARGDQWVAEQNATEWMMRLGGPENPRGKEVHEQILAAQNGEGFQPTTSAQTVTSQITSTLRSYGMAVGASANKREAQAYNAIASAVQSDIDALERLEGRRANPQEIRDIVSERSAMAWIGGKQVIAAPDAFSDNRGRQRSLGGIPEQHVEAVASAYSTERVKTNEARTGYNAAVAALIEAGLFQDAADIPPDDIRDMMRAMRDAARER